MEADTATTHETATDVVVVGAGLAGLSATLHLLGAGRGVTVLEREPEPGGRVADRVVNGYRIDTGASVLTMPEFLDEAFAAVGIASAKELGIDQDKVNVNGGAIAIGHPVGVSGARIVLHLALELKRRGGGIGAAALCGGGGQGDALIVKVPSA